MNISKKYQHKESERRLHYFELSNEIRTAENTDQLKDICQAVCIDLGFECYLFGGYFPLVEGVVVASTYPDEWRALYDEQGYVAIDPIVKHCWSDSSALAWHEIQYSDGKAGELEKKFMQDAHSYGLCSGITIPVHGSGSESCMLSLASSVAPEELQTHDEAGLHMIVHAVHDVTKHLLANSDAETVTNAESLSPREIECLSWTAKGKTSWAISRILNVSENTVIFHLRNAIKKLQVTNRSQAVAKAIEHSKIKPF